MNFAWEPIAHIKIPSHRITQDHVEFRVDLYICGAIASSAYRRYNEFASLHTFCTGLCKEVEPTFPTKSNLLGLNLDKRQNDMEEWLSNILSTPVLHSKRLWNFLNMPTDGETIEEALLEWAETKRIHQERNKVQARM